MMESQGAHKGSEKELEAFRAENSQLKIDLQNAKNKNNTLKQKLNLAEEKSVDLASKLLRIERSTVRCSCSLPSRSFLTSFNLTERHVTRGRVSGAGALATASRLARAAIATYAIAEE